MSSDTSSESSHRVIYYYKRKIWCWFSVLAALVCLVLFFVGAMANIGLMIGATGLGISSYFISPHKKDIDIDPSQAITELMQTEVFWTFLWELMTFPFRLIFDCIGYFFEGLTF